MKQRLVSAEMRRNFEKPWQYTDKYKWRFLAMLFVPVVIGFAIYLGRLRFTTEIELTSAQFMLKHWLGCSALWISVFVTGVSIIMGFLRK